MPLTNPNDKAQNADRRDRPTKYAIGPFSFDDEARTVTLAPGAYSFRNTVVFGVTKETVIRDAEYRPLGDNDSVPAVRNGHADYDVISR